MKEIIPSALFTVSVLLGGCTTYTQDANGNVVATTVIPVPLVDDGYAPFVSDYVGLPYIGGWNDGGYYNNGYYSANWNRSGYYNRDWNGHRGGAVAWRGPNGGGAAWRGTHGGGGAVLHGARGVGGTRGRFHRGGPVPRGRER